MIRKIKRLHSSRIFWVVTIGIIILSLTIFIMIQGTDVAVLQPKGFIASEQRKLLIISVLLLLEIGIPTLVVFYSIAWKYRETNLKNNDISQPPAKHKKSLVFGIWVFPIITMLLLSSVMWPAAHRLAPQKLIANDSKPLLIQVIAMRWKWVFIYPEQDIATVNFVQIPIDKPVQFQLTGDEVPMSSFWIPHLGGQLYAMTGHVNRLNLMADVSGDYNGSSAEINGSGFADMRFIARASTYADFGQWVENTKNSETYLDNISYQDLLKPSENNPARFFASVEPGLYDKMLMKYMGSHEHHMGGE